MMIIGTVELNLMLVLLQITESWV